MSTYRGRFAPSPTGPLHRGSLAAALASYADARAHGGKWLIRIENIDPPRERPEAAELQIATLARLGMQSDEPVLRQSTRAPAYGAALERLEQMHRIYRCACTRAQRAALTGKARAPAYPGTCRGRGLGPPHAARFRVTPGVLRFVDRAHGPFEQDVEHTVGDFIVLRADGLWAYQLAVVVDDAYQNISDVVRGADLLDNTPRQIELQRALGLATPRYLHVPLVLGSDGRKLSKHEGAAPLESGNALGELERAWQHLGFAVTGAATVAQFHERAVAGWRRRWLEPAGAPRAALAREGT